MQSTRGMQSIQSIQGYAGHTRYAEYNMWSMQYAKDGIGKVCIVQGLLYAE